MKKTRTKTLGLKSTQYYVACLTDALKILHENHFVHRDVKPENVLLNSQNIPKLSDFGCVKILEKLPVDKQKYSDPQNGMSTSST